MQTALQTARLFWYHASRYPRYVTGLAIFVPISVLAHQFVPPLIVANILDKLSRQQFNPGDLWGSFGADLVLYCVIVLLGSIVFWRMTVILIWKLEMLVQRDLAQRVFDHLMHQSAHFHANRFGGSLVSQAGKLLASYVRFIDTTVFSITTTIIAYLITVIVLLPRAPLFVAVLLLISLLYLIGAFYLTRPVQKRNTQEAAAQNRQTGYLADGITNVMAVKSFAAENYERNRFARATEETRASTSRLMHATLRRDLYSGTITTIISIAALILAVASVVIFNANIATVFLIITYTANITQRLWEFSAHVLRQYNRAFGDAAEMTQILNTQSDIQDPANPQPVRIQKGAIQFKNMTFAHADAKDDVLFRNLALTIRPGERVGLVGHSGSGKTTLTKVLLRYADINSGEVLIDGQNIAQITQADLRAHIAYVPQEPLLFHRSIRENIAYGRPNASQQDIVRAAEHAHAAEFIGTLPHGYDTLVGERGVKLSGGQRQRIAIARAMLKNAPILVLDEATSALDSESELLIQDALWQLMKGRTAIVIAHRLSTIQKMDRIVVMEHGAIIEQGSHKELLARKGVYANLWAHQSGGFIEE